MNIKVFPIALIDIHFKNTRLNFAPNLRTVTASAEEQCFKFSI